MNSGGTLHSEQHGTHQEVDHRGVGDICTLTVEEYFAAAKRLVERFYLLQDELVLTP